MLPKENVKGFLTFTPVPGPLAEGPVENHAFLSSFLDCGVWIRLLPAHSHLAVLQDVKASKVQRLGSLAGFYQQARSSVEDTLTTLVLVGMGNRPEQKIGRPDRTNSLAIRPSTKGACVDSNVTPHVIHICCHPSSLCGRANRKDYLFDQVGQSFVPVDLPYDQATKLVSVSSTEDRAADKNPRVSLILHFARLHILKALRDENVRQQPVSNPAIKKGRKESVVLDWPFSQRAWHWCKGEKNL